MTENLPPSANQEIIPEQKLRLVRTIDRFFPYAKQEDLLGRRKPIVGGVSFPNADDSEFLKTDTTVFYEHNSNADFELPDLKVGICYRNDVGMKADLTVFAGLYRLVIVRRKLDDVPDIEQLDSYEISLHCPDSSAEEQDANVYHHFQDTSEGALHQELPDIFDEITVASGLSDEEKKEKKQRVYDDHMAINGVRLNAFTQEDFHKIMDILENIDPEVHSVE